MGTAVGSAAAPFFGRWDGVSFGGTSGGLKGPEGVFFPFGLLGWASFATFFFFWGGGGRRDRSTEKGCDLLPESRVPLVVVLASMQIWNAAWCNFRRNRGTVQ